MRVLYATAYEAVCELQVAKAMKNADAKRQRLMLRAQGLSDEDLLEVIAIRARAKGLRLQVFW